MALEILVAAAVGIGVSAAVLGVMTLAERWGARRRMPPSCKTDLSHTDLVMARKTGRLVRERLGDDPVAALRAMSNRHRIAALEDFADRLRDLYQLDIEVDVTATAPDANGDQCFGSYQWATRRAQFNLMPVLSADEARFGAQCRRTLDAIVHEMRHAVQHNTVLQPGFWDVDEERRLAWGWNLTPDSYIPADVDMRAYASQPIERDAATFAAAALEEVLGE